jgi:hypothetical protein
VAAPRHSQRPQLVIAGHFGFAALVKSREPAAPLWGLMLASVWLDVVFIPLLLLGVEGLQTVQPGYGGAITHADYTHSIIGAILLEGAAGSCLPAAMGPAGGHGHRPGGHVALGPRSHRASA